MNYRLRDIPKSLEASFPHMILIWSACVKAICILVQVGVLGNYFRSRDRVETNASSDVEQVVELAESYLERDFYLNLS